MAERTAYSVEIRSSACVDNPIVRSSRKRKRVWTFESREAAQDWVEDLQQYCDNEIVLKDALLSGTVADGVLESKRAQASWSGI